MATLGNTYLNLIDIQRATGPDGKIQAAIAELLALTNPVLDDAIVVPANNGTTHTHFIRTGLPTVAWGMLYQGVVQSKSTRQQVNDTTGFVEGGMQVDRRMYDLFGDIEALKMSEAMGFAEAFNQEMATGIFYHDTAATPEKFKGLGARYGVKGGSFAGNQIVDAGGSGSDNTSVWFVTWAEWATHLIHPKNSPLGLQRETHEKQRVLDASGNPYYVDEDIWRWHLGLSVRDWRYNVRIANIDVSDLLDGTVDMYKWMRQAFYKLHSRRIARPGANLKNSDPSVPVSRCCIYMNRDVLEALDAAGTNARGGSTDNFIRLTPKELDGREVMTYRGIPIRETDALLNTEARVV